MIADLNTMPHMFWRCNREFFDHKLPTPKWGIMHTYRNLGRFEYLRNEKGKKRRHIKILMSDYFDFDEETFMNIMVHEMIHYYLLLFGTNDKCDLGTDFKAMAKEMNQKYGLNITTTFDASSIPSSPIAPKRTWWRCFNARAKYSTTYRPVASSSRLVKLIHEADHHAAKKAEKAE